MVPIVAHHTRVAGRDHSHSARSSDLRACPRARRGERANASTDPRGDVWVPWEGDFLGLSGDAPLYDYESAPMDEGQDLRGLVACAWRAVGRLRLTPRERLLHAAGGAGVTSPSRSPWFLSNQRRPGWPLCHAAPTSHGKTAAQCRWHVLRRFRVMHRVVGGGLIPELVSGVLSLSRLFPRTRDSRRYASASCACARENRLEGTRRDERAVEGVGDDVRQPQRSLTQNPRWHSLDEDPKPSRSAARWGGCYPPVGLRTQ